MTKVIGLTGGIGSGKSTIANFFKSFGIPVYIADEEGKKIMEFPEIVNEIKQAFGKSVVDELKLDKKKLAKIVFSDPQKLQKLNQIIHPLVKLHFNNWLLQNNNVPFVIKETAILFESGSYKDCDKIITVIAPLETRIKRVIERDKTTKKDVLIRIRNQWPDDKRIAMSDFIIENIDLTIAKAQVDEIVKKLLIQ